MGPVIVDSYLFIPVRQHRSRFYTEPRELVGDDAKKLVILLCVIVVLRATGIKLCSQNCNNMPRMGLHYMIDLHLSMGPGWDLSRGREFDPGPILSWRSIMN